MFYLGRDKVAEAETRLPGSPEVPEWSERFATLAQQASNPHLKRFYEAGAVAGETPIADVPMLSIDFETTGLDPEKDDIVSIGLVTMSLDRIRLREGRHWVVKPRADLRNESVVIHGITHSEVEDAPDLTRILEELLDLMAGHLMVVHHRGIERPFLDAALRQRIGEGIEFPVIDTMELEARLHRRRPPGLIDRLMGRSSESIRLADSRGRYNLPYYRPHNALTDALACAELLQAQVAHRFSRDTPVCELWH